MTRDGFSRPVMSPKPQCLDRKPLLQSAVNRVTIYVLGGRTKNEAGSVAGNQKDDVNSGELRQRGRSLNSSTPDPEEGVRLIRALLSIDDAEARRELIEFAEARARGKA